MRENTKNRLGIYIMCASFTGIGFVGGSFYNLAIGIPFTITVFLLIILGVELDLWRERKKKEIGPDE